MQSLATFMYELPDRSSLSPLFNKETKRDKSNYKTGSNSDKSAKPMYMHDTTATDLFVLQQSFQRIICT